MLDISPQQLLSEFEDLLRTMPPRATIRHEKPENHAWLGRAAALVNKWNPVKAPFFESHINLFHDAGSAIARDSAFRNISTTIHQAIYDLRAGVGNFLTVAVEEGKVFDYFDEIRKVIEGAKSDIFFINPYLDAEFVSRYLPHVAQGTKIRLLARERMDKLRPAVEAFNIQNSSSVEVRDTKGFHDRYIFVDGQACYQSRASFKDGAKKAPTTLTQITDAFDVMQETYEKMWLSAEKN